MSSLREKVRYVLFSRNVEISSFWAVFEEWINTAPNSREDWACVEKLKFTLVFKRELLLAYHMLPEDIPLKRILLSRIEFCEVNSMEWEEAAISALSVGMIQR